MGFGGLLNDDRNINTVDEMLGIIPGQSRTYVSSATGSIAMGGTPMNPQQLPIHTANCITGNTYGGLSAAATTILDANTGTGLTTTIGDRVFTKSTGSLAAGDVVYDNTNAYVGTVLTVSPSLTFVNYPTKALSSAAYKFIPSASKSTVAYTYDVSLPTDSMPANNVSYTIQAGDDFEQEVMKYAKCTGFSAQGGAGGAIDMNSSYMGQAVQLGYVGDGTITIASGTNSVSGSGTTFIGTSVSSDVGRKLYTLDNVLIGTIATVTSATAVVLEAAYTGTSLTNSQYRLGGFTKNTEISAPTDDLIFARARLFIDNEQAWPVTRPTPVVYQFLAFSMQLQCTWATKFTGEGYQGIDPTWAFALFTNYQVGGDFTVEHDTIASAKYSASSVESLKYAWRNRIPKIIQIDIPSATSVNWFTVSAAPTADTLTYTMPAVAAGTISISAADPLTVTGVGTSFTGSATKKLCVKVGNAFYYVGEISSVGGTTSATLSENLYGAIPAGTAFALDATAITAGATPFNTSTDTGKDVFKDATTWIGRIANVESTSIVHTYVSSAIGNFTSAAVTSFIMETATQPYFPVVGQGPLKSYTGVSMRFPVQIMNVSGINDNDGNDIVTVTWLQRYNPVVGNYGGDIRIVNQIPSLSVAM